LIHREAVLLGQSERGPCGITVSIVTYNNPAAEIYKLVHSLSGSTFLRHVVVFDNSPDESLRGVVESAGGKYMRDGRNIGFGAGHNLVLREFLHRTKYHVVVNPDISCSGGVLDFLYEFMERHEEVGLVMPRVVYPDGTEQRLCKQLPGPLDLLIRRFLPNGGGALLAARRARYELRHLDLNRIREVPCLSGCFMFLRASVLHEVGVFDERFFMYLEDVDLCRRIGERHSTVYNPTAVVTHGYAKASYKSLKLLLYHLQSGLRYFAKWGWVLDAQRERLNGKTGELRS
jgi:hypothetical protein